MNFVYSIFTLHFISFSLLTCFLCMTLSNMGLTFTKRCEAARRAREAASNRSTPNPVRAVERVLLAAIAATSSGDAATPTTNLGTSMGQSPQMTRPTDRSKGKEPIQSSGKRTREGASLRHTGRGLRRVFACLTPPA